MNSKGNKVAVIYNKQSFSNKASVSEYDLSFGYYKLSEYKLIDGDEELYGNFSWSDILLNKEEPLNLQQRFEVVFSNVIAFNADFTERVNIDSERA